MIGRAVRNRSCRHFTIGDISNRFFGDGAMHAPADGLWEIEHVARISFRPAATQQQGDSGRYATCLLGQIS